MKQSNHLVEFIRYQMLAMLEEEKAECDALKEEYERSGESYFNYLQALARSVAVIDCIELINECEIMFKRSNGNA